MNTSAPVGGKPPFSPPHDPDRSTAAGLATSMIQYCSDTQGRLNEDRLTGLLDRTIKYIKEHTGVLPSVVSGAAANDPASNNPTDPDIWDWNEWEGKLFKGRRELGFKALRYSDLYLICKTLSDYIVPDEGKILALFQHSQDASLTAAKVRNKLIDYLDVKIILQNYRGAEIFIKLLELYENKGPIMPAGLIKSAITLGYLPEEGIKKLIQLNCK